MRQHPVTRGLLSTSGLRLATLPLSALLTMGSAALVLRFGGSEQFAFVSLVGTLFLLLPFADLGLGAAITNAVSAQDARLPQILGTATTVLVGLGIALSFVTILIGLSGEWDEILGVPMSLRDVNAAVTLTLTLFALSVPLSLGQRILVGLRRTNELTLWNALIPLFSLGFTTIVVVTAAPVIYAAAAPSAAILVVSVLITVRAWRLLNLQSSKGSTFDIATFVAISKTAGPFLVLTFSTAVYLHSGRLVLSHTEQLQELASYALSMQIFLPLYSVVSLGAVALWPLYRANEKELYRIWRTGLATMFGIGLLVSTLYFLFTPSIVKVISGGALKSSLAVNAAISLTLLVLALHQASGPVATEGRSLRLQSVWALLAAIACVGLATMVAEYGALGVATATLFSAMSLHATPTALIARQQVTRS